MVNFVSKKLNKIGFRYYKGLKLWGIPIYNFNYEKYLDSIRPDGIRLQLNITGIIETINAVKYIKINI